MMKKLKFNYLSEDKKKKSIDCYCLEIPIYRVRIKIITPEKNKILTKDWNQDESDYDATAEPYLKQDGTVLIRINKFSLENIVHELYHATDFIMNYIGHKRTDESDEPSAYLIGYMFKEILKIKDKIEKTKVDKKEKT